MKVLNRGFQLTCLKCGENDFFEYKGDGAFLYDKEGIMLGIDVNELSIYFHCRKCDQEYDDQKGVI